MATSPRSRPASTVMAARTSGSPMLRPSVKWARMIASASAPPRRPAQRITRWAALVLGRTGIRSRRKSTPSAAPSATRCSCIRLAAAFGVGKQAGHEVRVGQALFGNVELQLERPPVHLRTKIGPGTPRADFQPNPTEKAPGADDVADEVDREGRRGGFGGHQPTFACSRAAPRSRARPADLGSGSDLGPRRCRTRPRTAGAPRRRRRRCSRSPRRYVRRRPGPIAGPWRAGRGRRCPGQGGRRCPRSAPDGRSWSRSGAPPCRPSPRRGAP